MNLRDVVLATMPPLLWAIAYTVAKPAMERFPPLFLMSMVYAVTALALMPIFGVMTAHLLLGEAITPVIAIGGAVILLGLVLVVRTPAPLVDAEPADDIIFRE